MQNKEEQLQEYQVRYHFWTDKKFIQLSFQNNIFLVVSIAMLGYFWKERTNVYTDLIINSRLSIDLKIGFFFIGILSLSYSIITGLLMAISRLYDLRLTSNILLTRKRALKRNVDLMPDEELLNNCVCKSAKSLWAVYWKYNDFLVDGKEIKSDNSSLKQKFTNIRQLSNDLGVCSWGLMKAQTLSLFIAIILLVIVLIIK
jgi:hypothetical protein